MKLYLAIVLMFISPSAFAQSRLTLVPGNPTPGEVIGATSVYYSSLGNAGPSLSLAGLPAGSVNDVFQEPGGALCSWSTPLPTLAQVPNGTPIHTGTGANTWTNVSAAFDGVLSKSGTAGALVISNVGMNNFIGQDFGIPVTISRVVVTPPNNDYVRGDAPPALQTEVDYSDDGVNFFSAASATYIPTVIGAFGPSYNYIYDFAATSHRYWRWGASGNGASEIKVPQLQFFGPTPYSRGLTWNGASYVAAADIPNCNSGGTPVDCPMGSCKHLGTIQIDPMAIGQVSCKLSYGLDAGCGISNDLNRVQICLKAGDARPPVTLSPPCHTGSSCWVYAPVIQPSYLFAPVEGNPLIRLRVLDGLGLQSVKASYSSAFFRNGQSAYWFGIGINGSNFPRGFWGESNYDSTTTQGGIALQTEISVEPFVGVTTFTALEGQSNGNISAFWGENNMSLRACFKY